MNKLKKSLALVAVLAIASSALVACGGNSSSTADTSSSKSESSAEESKDESSAEESKDESSEGGAAAELTNEDPTLSILSWTDNDLKNMFAVLFKENSEYNADNVKWVQVGTGGEEAREAQRLVGELYRAVERRLGKPVALEELLRLGVGEPREVRLHLRADGHHLAALGVRIRLERGDVRVGGRVGDN